MNWDDIKIFLEVARAERLSTAAKRLLMDASTVSRRLHSSNKVWRLSYLTEHKKVMY